MGDDGHEIANFTLSGWKAVAALVLIAAVVLGARSLQYSSLETKASDEIARYIVLEYIRENGEEVIEKVRAGTFTEADSEDLLGEMDVEITDIKAKGSDDETIVRVEYLVDGEPPANGQSPRYFKMSHSSLTGWMVEWEVWPISYYMKLF